MKLKNLNKRQINHILKNKQISFSMIDEYKFEANYSYPDGLTGNELIQILQDRFGFLDNYDAFVGERINQFISDNYELNEEYDIDEVLTLLFQEYLLTQSTGYDTNTNFPFINSGRLVNNTIVRYVEDYGYDPTMGLF